MALIPLPISSLSEHAPKRFSDSYPFAGGDPLGTYRHTYRQLVNGGLTGLTGGGSTNLDGWTTVGEDTNQVFNVISGSSIYSYVLAAGTDVQSLPDVVRPLDHTSITNEKVFRRLTPYGTVTTPGLTPPGYVVALSATTFASRTLTGTANQITVTNGDGTTGDPIFSLPTSVVGVNGLTSQAATNLALATGTGTSLNITLTPGTSGAVQSVFGANTFSVDNGGPGSTPRLVSNNALQLTSAGLYAVTLQGGGSGASLEVGSGANGAVTVTPAGSGSLTVGTASNGVVLYPQGLSTFAITTTSPVDDNYHFIQVSPVITSAGSSTDIRALSIDSELAGSTAAAGNRALRLRAMTSLSSAANLAVLQGASASQTHQGSGLVTLMNSYQGSMNVWGTGNVTLVEYFRANVPSFTSSGVIAGDTKGLAIYDIGTTDSTGVYGAWVDDQTKPNSASAFAYWTQMGAGAGGKWAFYGAGTAPSYLGGALTVAGTQHISDTTDATDATGTTGALGMLGGLSVAKKGFLGAGLSVTGVGSTIDNPVVNITGTATDIATNKPIGLSVSMEDTSASTTSNGAVGLKATAISNRTTPTSGGVRSVRAVEAFAHSKGYVFGAAQPIYGVYSYSLAEHTSGVNSDVVGVYGGATANTTVVNVVGARFHTAVQSLGDVTGSVIGVQVNDQVSVGYPVGTRTQLSLGNVTASSPTANAYGVLVGDVTGATNNYAVHTGSGLVRFGDTTDATDATGTTGALGTLGGLSVAKSGWFGSGVRVAGSVTSSGALFHAVGTAASANNPTGAYIEVEDTQDTSGAVGGMTGLSVRYTSNRSGASALKISGYGTRTEMIFNGSVPNSSTGYGASSAVTLSNATSGSFGSLIGVSGSANYNAGNLIAVGRLIGGSFTASVPDASFVGAVTDAIGLRTAVLTPSYAGAVTNAYGLLVSSITDSSIGSSYGIRVENVSGASANNYAIHTGTGLVRFGDSVTSTGNITASGTLASSGGATLGSLSHSDNAGLWVLAATATSTTQYGAFVSAPASSAATTAGYGLFARARFSDTGTYTTVSAVAVMAEEVMKGLNQTLTNNYGVMIGARSVGTNRYGLYVHNVTGGTLNYSIYTNNGQVRIGGIAEYADNAAALGAGLAAGVLYRTGDILKIVN